MPCPLGIAYRMDCKLPNSAIAKHANSISQMMIPGKKASNVVPRRTQIMAVIAMVASNSWVMGRKRKRLAMDRVEGIFLGNNKVY